MLCEKWICRTTLLAALSIAGCASLRGESDQFDELGSGSRDRSGILGVNSDVALQSAKSAIGLGPNQSLAKELYGQAEQQYREASQLEAEERGKRFLEAASTFSKAAKRWPNSSLEEDALFHMGECYFFADRYPKADQALGRLVKKYPNTRHIDTANARRFALARYWVEHQQQNHELAVTPNLVSRDRPVFDKFGNAVKVLEQIRLDDPTGELADDATMAAAAACFTEDDYYRADELLTDLRRSYPNSKHQFDAHLLGLKCKTKLYQGPSYDGGPLDEAEELIKQMRRQFPRESREHDEFLTKAWKDVRMNRAIREMNLARYFDRRKEYRAARQHYRNVTREFSDTSLSSDANERLAQLGGLPDKPPQRLAWLVDIFPTPDREQPLVARNPLDVIRR